MLVRRRKAPAQGSSARLQTKPLPGCYHHRHACKGRRPPPLPPRARRSSRHCRRGSPPLPWGLPERRLSGRRPFLRAFRLPDHDASIDRDQLHRPGGLEELLGEASGRLLPALALMLLGVTIYASLVAQPSDLHEIRIDALATKIGRASCRE